MSVGAVAEVPLRSHPVVRGLVAAEITSVLGTQLSVVAIPWLVLNLTGSPRYMGLVVAAQFAGMAVMGATSAAWVGRFSPRRVMLAADLLCAPLIAALLVLHLFGALHIAVFAAVMFVVGGCAAPFLAGQQAVLVGVTSDETRLSRVSAILQSAGRAGMLVGPVLAGLLISLVDAPLVLLVDATSYAISALIHWRCLPRTPAPAPGRQGSLTAGLRALLANRLTAGWSAGLVLAEVAWQGLFALLPVFAVVRYAGSPTVAGVLLSAFGCGALVGALLVGVVLRRTSARTLALVGRVVLCAAFAVLLLPLTLPSLIGCLVVVGLLNGQSNSSLSTVRMLSIPENARPAALTVATAIALGGGTAGWALAGVVAESAGLHAAVLCAVSAQVAATALFVFGVTGTGRDPLPAKG
ncbi:MFS transporter [Umezawaea sp. NPDC059074]|uniref:MFS transporter n=1 Tax=Umezawaea sp. NPDC059074 TaxID=3346716 RepID=UPI0036CD9B7F